MVKQSTLLIAAALGLGACQHGSDATPAVLEERSDKTMAAVKSALTETVGRVNFEFGVGDPTKTAQIIVLPPPLSPQEDRSPVSPTVFDLVMKDGVCYAIHPDTRAEIELVGVSCRPL
jgi:hypothetical protein